jgi:hypothetical protein
MTTTADHPGLRPVTARFLDRFVASSATGDGAGLHDCFADTFLAGDVDGASTVVPREAFIGAMPARVAAARAAGIGPAALVDASETPLGGAYWLLSTRWTAPRQDGEDMALASTFLLADTADGTHAVAYLTHEGLAHRLPTGPNRKR